MRYEKIILCSTDKLLINVFIYIAVFNSWTNICLQTIYFFGVPNLV